MGRNKGNIIILQDGKFTIVIVKLLYPLFPTVIQINQLIVTKFDQKNAHAQTKEIHRNLKKNHNNHHAFATFAVKFLT